MSYYFKHTDTTDKPVKLPSVDYSKVKADFLKKLGEGITNRAQATELRKELDKTIEAAKETLRAPKGEILALLRAYRAELDKAVATNEQKYNEVLDKAAEEKAKQYIDPTYTPELEAKVNALALSYVGELHRMHGQEARKSELYNKALATREGALALLKLPADTLPSRIQSKALELSKTAAAVTFEKAQAAELEQLNKQTYTLYSEGFQYRTIAKNLDRETTSLVRELAAGEGAAV